MKRLQLTKACGPATSRLMRQKASRLQKVAPARMAAGMMVVAGALALGGCISVTAPDKPIVIELNINIKQEVVYRLAADAGNTVEKNGDIF